MTPIRRYRTPRSARVDQKFESAARRYYINTDERERERDRERLLTELLLCSQDQRASEEYVARGIRYSLDPTIPIQPILTMCMLDLARGDRYS